MMPPTSIDGTDITGATIDGTDVQEITLDGQTVFTAGPLPTIVDSFEDQNVSEYGGITNGASFVSSPVADGQYALSFSNIGGSFDDINSTTGLNAYPSAGTTIKYNMQLTDTDDDGVFSFGTQSSGEEPPGYRAEIRADVDELRIAKREASLGFLGTTSAPISNHLNELLEGELVWGQNGDIDFTVFDSVGAQIATLSVTDTTFTSGGVGIGLFNGEVVSNIFVDYIRFFNN